MDPLWVDKYRPKALERLDHHPNITSVLKQLAETNDFPVLDVVILSISFFMDLKGQAKKHEPMPFSINCSESMCIN